MLGSDGLLGMFDVLFAFAIQFGLSHHTHMFRFLGFFAAIPMTAIFCFRTLDLRTLQVYTRFSLSPSGFVLSLPHFCSCTILSGLYILGTLLTRTYTL